MIHESGLLFWAIVYVSVMPLQ